MPESPTPNPAPTAGLDASFLRRVYIASGVLAVLGGAVGAFRLSPQWGLGFFAFAAWATVNLWALARTLQLVVAPKRNTLDILGALALKIPILYTIGFFLLFKSNFPAVSIVAGISVPLVAVVLKAVGRVLAPKVALPTHTQPNSQ